MPLRTLLPSVRTGGLGAAGAATWRFLGSSLFIYPLLALFVAAAALILLVPGAPGATAFAGLGAAPEGGLLPAAGACASALMGMAALRALLAALAVACAVRLVERLVPAWWLPPLRAGGLWVAGGAGVTEAGLASALRRAGLRQAAQRRRGGRSCVVAVPAGARGWLLALPYLGALVLIGALFFHWRAAWVGPEVDVAVGETRSLGGGSEMAVTLERIELAGRAEGGADLLRGVLQVRGRQGTLLRVAVGPGQPARVGSAHLYVTGYGPTVRVQACDERGRALDVRRMVGDTALATSVQVRFAGAQQEQLVLVPDADLIVRLVYYTSLPSSGQDGPVILAQAQRASSEEPLGEAFVADTDTLVVAEARVSLVAGYSMRVRAARQPAWPWAVAGAALVLAGTLVSLTAHRGALWVLSGEAEANPSEVPEAPPGQGDGAAHCTIALVAGRGKGGRALAERVAEGLRQEE